MALDRSGLGSLQQTYIRGTGGSDPTVQAYSATVTARLGPVVLTSLTGYTVNRYNDSVDVSSILGEVAGEVYGVGGAPIFDRWPRPMRRWQASPASPTASTSRTCPATASSTSTPRSVTGPGRSTPSPTTSPTAEVC